MAERYAHIPTPDGYAALPKAARAVWNALCYHQRWANGEAVPLGCFPSQAQIAKTAGISRRTVYSGIQQLEKLGWIARVTSRFGSVTDSTHYVLLAVGQTMPSMDGQKLLRPQAKTAQATGKNCSGREQNFPTNNTSINNTSNIFRGTRQAPRKTFEKELKERAAARENDPFYQ